MGRKKSLKEKEKGDAGFFGRNRARGGLGWTNLADGGKIA